MAGHTGKAGTIGGPKLQSWRMADSRALRWGEGFQDLGVELNVVPLGGSSRGKKQELGFEYQPIVELEK